MPEFDFGVRIIKYEDDQGQVIAEYRQLLAFCYIGPITYGIIVLFEKADFYKPILSTTLIGYKNIAITINKAISFFYN